MKKILINISILLVVFQLNSQSRGLSGGSSSSLSSMSDLTASKLYSGGDIFVLEKMKKNNNIDAVGNTYLFEEFKNGSIQFKDGKKYEADLRFDISNQNFEIKGNDGKVTPISINENVEIYLDNQRYTMHSVMLGEKGDLAVLRDVVVNNKLELYFFPRKVLELPTESSIQAPSSGYAKKTKKAQWKEAHIYLIKSKGNYIEVPKSHKKMSLLGVFNEKEYKSYRKQNKIDLKKEKDLIMLINHFSN